MEDFKECLEKEREAYYRLSKCLGLLKELQAKIQVPERKNREELAQILFESIKIGLLGNVNVDNFDSDVSYQIILNLSNNQIISFNNTFNVTSYLTSKHLGIMDWDTLQNLCFQEDISFDVKSGYPLDFGINLADLKECDRIAIYTFTKQISKVR